MVTRPSWRLVACTRYKPDAAEAGTLMLVVKRPCWSPLMETSRVLPKVMTIRSSLLKPCPLMVMLVVGGPDVGERVMLAAAVFAGRGPVSAETLLAVAVTMVRSSTARHNMLRSMSRLNWKRRILFLLLCAARSSDVIDSRCFTHLCHSIDAFSCHKHTSSDSRRFHSLNRLRHKALSITSLE